jgi:hypothetical protein
MKVYLLADMERITDCLTNHLIALPLMGVREGTKSMINQTNNCEHGTVKSPCTVPQVKNA